MIAPLTTSRKGGRPRKAIAITWLTMGSAAEKNGMGRNTLRLHMDICGGGLIQGHHWRDVRPPGSKRAVYQFNAELLTEYFAMPPGDRAINVQILLEGTGA